MGLCHDCDGLAVAISRRLKYWPGLDSFWNAARRRAGSRDCRLCKMMSDYMFENPDVHMAMQPGKNRPSLEYGTPDMDVDSPLSHVFLTSTGRGEPDCRAEISVWSDPGSSAAKSGDICTTPQLTSDNGPEAFALANSWIKTCFQQHELCKRTMSGNLINEDLGPQLPTRVLDVGIAGCEHISLIESNGRHGNFCALSYCWGPKGTQTMITTRDNIHHRLGGIPFGSLPKTFQDAVTVTRAIGIRYLWIDSLCIIQGDKQDWANEAGKMAGVYQNAHLVIAASGAENPEQGCYSSQRRCPYAVSVPYYSSRGRKDGLMWLSVPVQRETSPYWGPLRQRGWALQESCLARRILRFTPAGMIWRCSGLMTSERYSFAWIYPEVWEEILEDFSDCKLTYKEDRLVALEGLGRAIQEVTRDKYTLGIFESSIPEQLFWMLEDAADESEDLAALPSWHWASRGGPKIFMTKDTQVCERSYPQFILEPSGILKAQGFVAECGILSTRPGRADVALDQLLLAHPYLQHISPRCIQTPSGPAQLAGIAVFDDEGYERVHVLFLMQWEEYDRWVQDRINLKFPHGKGIIKTLYLVLLLRPSPAGEGIFKRVGVGLVILDPESDGISATLKNITLV